MARTESKWKIGSDGTYIQTISATGYNVLINGANKYLNFGTVSGTTGYGFRDNNGVIEFKDSGGSWATVTQSGPTISATSPIFYNMGVISSQPASSTDSGYITTGAQDIIGEKTFLNRIVVAKSVDSAVIANSTTGRSMAIVSGALKSSFLFDNGGPFSIQTNTKTNVNNGTPSGVSLFEISAVGDASIGTTTVADQPRLDVLFSQTAITTASKTVIRGRNAGSTFQTGGQAKTNYIAEFINTATRNSGANPLTNVALYASASGGQFNYAGVFIGDVVIGGNTPNANAILDIQSTTKAFMPPRMTTTQKNAVSSPTAGMMVYDTTLNKLCVYTTAWEVVTSV